MLVVCSVAATQPNGPLVGESAACPSMVWRCDHDEWVRLRCPRSCGMPAAQLHSMSRAESVGDPSDEEADEDDCGANKWAVNVAEVQHIRAVEGRPITRIFISLEHQFEYYPSSKLCALRSCPVRIRAEFLSRPKMLQGYMEWDALVLLMHVFIEHLKRI